MIRHGGQVRIRSAAGQGTEVALTVRRHAPDARPPAGPGDTGPAPVPAPYAHPQPTGEHPR